MQTQTINQASANALAFLNPDAFSQDTVELSIGENTGVTVEEKAVAMALATPGGMESFLKQVKDQANDAVAGLDPNKAADAKKIKSIAYKVSQAKTFIAGVHKKAVQPAKDEMARIKSCISTIDENNKLVGSNLDGLRDEIKAEVVKLEEAAEARKKQIADTLVAIQGLCTPTGPTGERLSSAFLTVRQEKLRAYLEDAKAEFADDMAEIIAAAEDGYQNHKVAIAQAMAFEEQQAEIERLKQEKAEAAAAQERERIAAAEKLQAQKDAEARAARAELEKEQAEKRAAEAETMADKQAADAAEAAKNAERQRADDEAKKAEDEAKARQADHDHRKSINTPIYQAMVSCGASPEAAKAFLTMVAKGEVPNIKIHY